MRTCPSCGLSVPESFESCDNCGHSFGADDRDDNDDGPRVSRLTAAETVLWSVRRLLGAPGLLVLALIGGLAGGLATLRTGGAVQWLLTTTAALYPAAVAHRYAGQWVDDEEGGRNAYFAALRRLPVLFVVYLAVGLLAVLSLVLVVLVFRPAIGLFVWLGLFVYLLLRLVLAGPAAVVGEHGPIRSLGEGWVASSGATLKLFGLVVLLVVAGVPFELLGDRSAGVQLTAAAGSGLLSTLSAVAFAHVYLSQAAR